MIQTLQTSKRLEGLDLARYVALVGMVIVNFNVVMVGPGTDISPFNSVANLFEGRAAATFVVLAGIGLGMAATRLEWSQMRYITLKRAGFLLVIGLLNSLIFEADIIHYYAVYFFCALIFLRLPTWALLLVIAGLVMAFVVMALLFNYDEGWDWSTYTYNGFWTFTGFFRNLFFNGWHPVVPWLGFILLGVVIGRLSLEKPNVQCSLLIGGVVMLGVVTAVSHGLIAIVIEGDAEAAILFATDPVPPMPLYIMAGGSVACLVIGLCLLLERPLRAIGVLELFIPAGRQTLTLYIAHIVIGMGVMEALDLIGGQAAYEALLASMLFCIAATLYAHSWARFYQRGPLESLMRKITG